MRQLTCVQLHRLWLSAVPVVCVGAGGVVEEVVAEECEAPFCVPSAMEWVDLTAAAERQGTRAPAVSRRAEERVEGVAKRGCCEWRRRLGRARRTHAPRCLPAADILSQSSASAQSRRTRDATTSVLSRRRWQTSTNGEGAVERLACRRAVVGQWQHGGVAWSDR